MLHSPIHGGRRARLVWLVALMGMAAIGLLTWVYVSRADAVTAFDIVTGTALLVGLGAFVLSGAIVAVHQPANVIGPLLMVPGLVLPLSELANQWLASFDPPPTAVGPILWLVLWAIGWSWAFLIFPIFHVMLTFPDGRLLSPRWRWAVALEIVMVTVIALLAAFSPTLGPVIDDRPVWRVANPIAVLSADFMDTGFGTLWAVGLIGMTVLSVMALVLRFRRGTPQERHQLKWPLGATLLFGAIYVELSVQQSLFGTSTGPLLGFGLAALPISVAIAVLRYRLYEIDRIISRTIGWTLVTGLLLAVFVGIVLVLQELMTGFTQRETVAVVISTLVAFSLFQPVRGRVQRAVDRRFDRGRYDGQRTAEAFADRLRTNVAIDSVIADLSSTVELAIRPSTVSTWLRDADR